MTSEDNSKPAATAAALSRAIALMAQLRGPHGCPWDREQTFDSIKRHTLEETYEVFDAIDRRAWPDLRDELGDLLLQVLFYAQMADEAGFFSLEDVANNLNAKLIRRHPHIFADAAANTPDEVKQTWEAVKQNEKAAKGFAPALYLDEVPQHIPALLEASKLGQRCAKIGFDWPDPSGLLSKLAEETDELRAEIERSPQSQSALEDELGDLLFTTVHLARHLHLEPEFALRKANRKFRARFSVMERNAGGATSLRKSTPEELDRSWLRAKQALSDQATMSSAAHESPPGSSSQPPE